MSNIQRELPRRNFSGKKTTHFLNRETEGELHVSAQNAPVIPEKRVGGWFGGPCGVFKIEILQENVKENHDEFTKEHKHKSLELENSAKASICCYYGERKKSFHAHKKKKNLLCLQCLTISAGNQLVPLSGSGEKKDEGPVQQRPITITYCICSPLFVYPVFEVNVCGFGSSRLIHIDDL